MTKVLIVEDDEMLGDELRDVFVQWGFVAITVASVNAFWEQVEDFKPQLIVVDLTLPDGSGVDIIRDVRSKSDIGIIVMSGRSDEIERVVCIETGADDYLTKPFNPRELIARLRAVLRRYGSQIPQAGGQPSDADAEYAFGQMVLDIVRRELRSNSGEEIPLTNAEYRLLEFFLRHPNEIVPRTKLLEELGSDLSQYVDRTVDVLILRLRRKIERVPSKPIHLQTRRGQGYIFVTNDASERA
mgnify:CR=1 FL=1